jgi:hypothetical protein
MSRRRPKSPNVVEGDGRSLEMIRHAMTPEMT